MPPSGGTGRRVQRRSPALNAIPGLDLALGAARRAPARRTAPSPARIAPYIPAVGQAVRATRAPSFNRPLGPNLFQQQVAQARRQTYRAANRLGSVPILGQLPTLTFQQRNAVVQGLLHQGGYIERNAQQHRTGMGGLTSSPLRLLYDNLNAQDRKLLKRYYLDPVRTSRNADTVIGSLGRTVGAFPHSRGVPTPPEAAQIRRLTPAQLRDYLNTVQPLKGNKYGLSVAGALKAARGSQAGGLIPANVDPATLTPVGTVSADALARELAGRGPDAALAAGLTHLLDKAAAKAPGTTSAGPGAPQIGVNLAKDIINIPAKTIPSTVSLAETAFKNPGEAGRQLLHQVTSLADLGAWAQHPGYNLATLFGIGGVAGRLRRIRARPPATLTHGGEPVGKTARPSMFYSRQPLAEAAQRVKDRRPIEIKSQRGQRALMRDLSTVHDLGHQQLRNIREQVVAEHVRRFQPSKTKRVISAAGHNLQVQNLVPGAEDAARLVAQGTLRRPETMLADVEKHLAKVRANRANLGSRGLQQLNQQTIDALTRLRDDLKGKSAEQVRAKYGPLFNAAHQHAVAYAPLEKQLIARGFADKEAAVRAPLVKFALDHYPGARYDTALGRTRTQAASEAFRQATKDFRAATRARDTAAEAAARMQGRAAVLSRNVGGRRAEIAAMLRRDPRYAGGGHGARQALAKLDEAQGRVNATREQLRKAGESARAARRYAASGALVDASGKVIPTDELQAFAARETGGRPLAFVSDKDTGQFSGSMAVRPTPSRGPLTGYQHEHGLTDVSHEALLRQSVDAVQKLARNDTTNRTLGHFTMAAGRNAKGEPVYARTFHDAQRAAEHMGRDENGKPYYVPVAIGQQFHPQGALRDALGGMHPADMEQFAEKAGLTYSSRLGVDAGPGRYGIVPRSVAEGLIALERNASGEQAMRIFGMLTNQWRNVALATPRHVVGVSQEQAIRLAAEGAGPLSKRAGGRYGAAIENAADPQAAEALRTLFGGGALSGSALRAVEHTIADRYSGTTIHPVLTAWQRVVKAPGPGLLAGAWNAYRLALLKNTRHFIEENAQSAMLGKTLLRVFASEHGMADRLMRRQGDFLDQLARRHTAQLTQGDMSELISIKREIERMQGKWSGLTPNGRALLRLTPFGLWYANSVRWLYRLPIDHPVKTGALATVVGAANVPADKDVPLGSQFEYYSPFGIFGEPAGLSEGLTTAGSMIAPHVASLVLGTLGINAFGSPLRTPHGGKVTGEDKLKYIANSLLGAGMPFYRQGQTVAAGGASQYDTSSLLLGMQRKSPSGGIWKGLWKVLRPYRQNLSQAGASDKPGQIDWSTARIAGGSGDSGDSGGGSGQIDWSTARIVP